MFINHVYNVDINFTAQGFVEFISSTNGLRDLYWPGLKDMGREMARRKI